MNPSKIIKNNILLEKIIVESDDIFSNSFLDDLQKLLELLD
jgi:hypothetical protein